jgi:RNase P/RNase MRP subunit p30
MNERKFYDLNIAFESDREAIIKRAQELELSGICLVHTYKGEKELEAYLKEIKRLRGLTSVDIISGVMLEGEEEMVKIAKKIRKSVDIILAFGGRYQINRLACSSDYIDILAHPEKGRRDCGLDHICCKEAKDHGTVIEINFNEILSNSGFKRLDKFHLLKESVRLCMNTQAPFIVNSGAKNIWELRAGRELTSLSCVLGAGAYPSLASNSELPERLIMNNRSKIKMPLKGVVVQNE